MIDSEFIFNLGRNYGFIGNNAITDEGLEKFIQEYSAHVINRRKAIAEHLTNDSLFRTFIPWRNGVFGAAFQVHWYYDEILTYDPIEMHLSTTVASDESKREDFKQTLKGIYNNLLPFEAIISSGQLLFISANEYSYEDANKEAYSSIIKEDKAIARELLLKVGMAKLEGNPGGSYTVRTSYRSTESLIPIINDVEALRNDDGKFSLMMPLAGNNEILKVEDLERMGILDKVAGDLADTVWVELYELTCAMNEGAIYNAPALLNQKLDELVINNWRSTLPIGKAEAQIDFELTLPYVDGIDPERLAELRASMPNIFKDFRNYLNDVRRDIQSKSKSNTEFKEKIESHIRKEFRRIDTEMQSATRKFRLLTVGVPIVCNMGGLLFSQYGSILEAMAISDGVSLPFTVKGAVDLKNVKDRVKTEDLYFLWKAQQ